MILSVLKSENLKFFFNKWILLTSISTLILVPSMTIFLNKDMASVDFSYISTQILQSLYLGQAAFIINAILYFGSEFLGSTIRTSLISVPNRLLFLVGKVVTIILWGTILFLVTATLSIVVVQNYYQYDLVGSLTRLVILLFPVYFATISLSLLASGLTIITNSFVLTLGICLSILLGLGQMLLQFSSLFKIFPILATMNCFYNEYMNIYLNKNLGLLIQFLWCLSIITVSYVLLRKRAIR